MKKQNLINLDYYAPCLLLLKTNEWKETTIHIEWREYVERKGLKDMDELYQHKVIFDSYMNNAIDQKKVLFYDKPLNVDWFDPITIKGERTNMNYIWRQYKEKAQLGVVTDHTEYTALYSKFYNYLKSLNSNLEITYDFAI